MLWQSITARSRALTQLGVVHEFLDGSSRISHAVLLTDFERGQARAKC